MLSDYGILILIANENTAKCTIKYFMNIFWSNNFGFYYIKLIVLERYFPKCPNPKYCWKKKNSWFLKLKNWWLFIFCFYLFYWLVNVFDQQDNEVSDR